MPGPILSGPVQWQLKFIKMLWISKRATHRDHDDPFCPPPSTPAPALPSIGAEGGIAFAALTCFPDSNFQAPRPKKGSTNLTGAFTQAHIEIFQPLPTVDAESLGLAALP